MIDLSNAKEPKFEVLPAGKYNVFCNGAAVMDTKNGTGQYVQAEFVVMEGSYEGKRLFHNFNIKNQNQKAVDIGLGQLKSFLRYAKYPTPDSLGDVSALEGLKTGVVTKVRSDEQWGDKAEIARFSDLTSTPRANPSEQLPF